MFYWFFEEPHCSGWGAKSTFIPEVYIVWGGVKSNATFCSGATRGGIVRRERGGSGSVINMSRFLLEMDCFAEKSFEKWGVFGGVEKGHKKVHTFCG